MSKHKDYYRILQVHYLAEPEVIDGAYKKLAKKYHPDVNKNKSSTVIMQEINRAYDELSNPVKRQRYNLNWQDKCNLCGSDCEHKKVYADNEKLFLAAKSVIDEYFSSIMNNQYDHSYELISNIDKLNITQEDFINWKHSVSKVFHLTDYKCKICGTYKNKLLNGHKFDYIAEFGVNVVEYNAVMGMMGKDEFSKMVVLEDGEWRVFVGYEKLQPLISKFKELNSLLTAKSVINELVETQSKVDSLTKLLNQRGIIERIENEIHRLERYGNVFSLIMCDMDISNMNDTSMEQEAKDQAMKFVAEILLTNLRKLDVVGRWGDKTFLILVPETGLTSAIKVTEKIDNTLKTKVLVYEDKTYKLSAKFGTVEYVTSLEESLARINRQINIS